MKSRSNMIKGVSVPGIWVEVKMSMVSTDRCKMTRKSFLKWYKLPLLVESNIPVKEVTSISKKSAHPIAAGNEGTRAFQ